MSWFFSREFGNRCYSHALLKITQKIGNGGQIAQLEIAMLLIYIFVYLLLFCFPYHNGPIRLVHLMV